MKTKHIIKALTAITAIFLLSLVFALFPSAEDTTAESLPEAIRVAVRVSCTVTDAPEDAAGKAFNFEVVTLDGAPLPDTERFALTDGGEREIHITFDRPGIYSYRVHQLAGTEERWSYDSTVWLVDVYVFTDDAGKLTPSVIIRPEDGDKAALCSFQNRYFKPDEPPNPDTGDNGAGVIPAVLGVCAVAAVSVLLISRSRRREEE